MKPSHLMKDKNYPSLGFCIFCMQSPTTENLTEEHIIAYGLNGTLRFKGATCKKCAEAGNKYFEQPVMANDFLIMFNHQNFQ